MQELLQRLDLEEYSRSLSESAFYTFLGQGTSPTELLDFLNAKCPEMKDAYVYELVATLTRKRPLLRLNKHPWAFKLFWDPDAYQDSLPASRELFDIVVNQFPMHEETLMRHGLDHIQWLQDQDASFLKHVVFKPVVSIPKPHQYQIIQVITGKLPVFPSSLHYFSDGHIIDSKALPANNESSSSDMA